MQLAQISIGHFRNLHQVDIHPAPHVNCFYGQNGSGKSSLLEAIHYLGFGRSFRTNKHDNVIANGSNAFILFAKAQADLSSQLSQLGLSRDLGGEFDLRINGTKYDKLSSLANLVPIQVFTPQSGDLLSGSPGNRRRFLDWGLFHVEHSYVKTAQTFSQALKQRNALLRVGLNKQSTEQLNYWNSVIAQYGEVIDSKRQVYVDQLAQCLSVNAQQMLPEFDIGISYTRGWDKQTELLNFLEHKLERDLQLGYTSSGPQKADIKFTANGQLATEILSRGQLRMLMAALLLSRSQCLTKTTNKVPLVLLDDLSAELDDKNREVFVEQLVELNSQLFITGIEKQQFDFAQQYKSNRLFHVKHGQITQEM